MTGHLPAQVVSDLDAGLLQGSAADGARAHLAACDTCAGTQAALRGVRARLAAADPGPLPADIATRLDAALAAEAARGRITAHTAVHPGARALEPASRSPRRSFRSYFTPARVLPAMALALLLGTGAVAVSSVDRGAGTSSTAGGGLPASAEAGPAQAGGAAATAASPPPVTFSGRNYSTADLPTAARALVADPEQARDAAAQAPMGANRASTESGATGPAAPFASEPALGSCLQGLKLTGRVLRADVGTFRGSPVLVVVAMVDDDPDQLDVRVVGIDCSASDPHQLAVVRTGRS